MEKKTDYSNVPTAEYPFFMFEPDGDFYFFKTLEEATLYANEQKDLFLDESWDESVEQIMVGHVYGTMCKTNLVERPDVLDKDGRCKKTDTDWHPDWNYICDYQIKALGDESSKIETKKALKQCQ